MTTDVGPAPGQQATRRASQAGGQPWPHHQLLHRGHGSVQVGHEPGAGLVVDGLDEAEVRLLSSDRPAASHRMTWPDPSARVRRESVLHALLTVADAGGRASPSRVTARRSRQRVVVCGSGGVPEAVARLLRQGGVPAETQPHSSFPAADSPTKPTDRRADRDQPPSAAARLPDLVVLTSVRPLSWSAGEPWRQRGVTQLPVVVHRGRICVGPILVRGGTCLGCLHLHRADRDARWSALARQLSATAVLEPQPVTALPAVTALAAALAATVGHAYLDGEPVPVDLSVEAGEGWPGLDYRRWPPHPGCPCRGVPSEPPDVDDGPEPAVAPP